MGLTDLMIYNDEGLPNGLKYNRIPLYIVEVIKDQQTEIEELHETIVTLAKRLDRLEKQRR